MTIEASGNAGCRVGFAVAIKSVPPVTRPRGFAAAQCGKAQPYREVFLKLYEAMPLSEGGIASKNQIGSYGKA